MKRFFIYNYRGIFHIICLLDFVFFAWIFGINEVYDLVPSHFPVKIIFLAINFFVAEWTIKKSEIDIFLENEKKKLKK